MFICIWASNLSQGDKEYIIYFSRSAGGIDNYFCKSLSIYFYEDESNDCVKVIFGFKAIVIELLAEYTNLAIFVFHTDSRFITN